MSDDPKVPSSSSASAASAVATATPSPMASDDAARVHLVLLGMALLWGASWPAGRALAQAMPPMSASAVRFSIAVVLLWAWFRVAKGRAWPSLTPRQWAGLALAGTVGVFGYSAFFMLALSKVEASRSAVVVTTNPVFTTLLAAWLFKERFNARIALGLALAVAGAVVVMTRGDPRTLLDGGGLGVGEWLLLGCIVTWCAYTLMGRRLMAGIDSLTATTVTTAVGGVLLWVAALAVDGPLVLMRSVVELDGRGWFSLLFLAVGSTVLAYAWYYRGVAALGAGTASSYISLVPVIGVATSVLVLGEPMTGALLVGGALAIVGVMVANRARR